MNAAKAASRMRSRTAVSSLSSRRRFDIPLLDITVTSFWYRIVPNFTLSDATFLLSIRLNHIVPNGTKAIPKFREESKELKNEDGNVFPAADARYRPGTPGARPGHAAQARNHRRADDPFAKGWGYSRPNYETHARRNSCDRSPVSRGQDSAVVYARRRQGRHLHSELQGRGGGSRSHGNSASLEGKPCRRAVHSGRTAPAAGDTVERCAEQ